MVCLNIAYTKNIEKLCTVLGKNDIIPVGKRIPKKTQEEYQQLTTKGRDTSSFSKLSPYYSKHVLPYYVSRAASPQVDGYPYSMHV